MAGIDKIYGTATQWDELVVVYCAAFLTATARFPWNEPKE